SAPGAIAVNLSALAGYRVAGRCGLAVSAVAAVTPPVVILTLISFYYSAFNAAAAAALRGMQAAAAALIADFVIDLSRSVIRERSPLLTLMMPAVFIAGFFLKIGAGTILAACALTALLRIVRRAGRAAA
ncbi:MAG: chromate transporter, partial [Cloacibacillus porcorum]|nr:chromate transporter [Cloacibacillus porcorum]